MARARSHLPGAFWRLWTGRLISDLGDGVVLVALPLLALTITHDPVKLSGVLVAEQLPPFVLCPFIGVLIDRVDRRLVLAVVQLLQFAVTGGLALLIAAGTASLALLYGAAALLGACAVTFGVCTSVVVPGLVADADLERANGRMFVAEASARDLAGQGLGGLVFAAGRAVPFVADAFSFVASAALLIGAVPGRRPSLHQPGRSWRTELADGFRFFAANRQLRRLAVMMCTFAGCQAAAFATLALYLTTAVHASHTMFGVLLMVGSVGSLTGTAVASRLVERHGSWAAIAIGGTAAGYAYALLASHPVAAVSGLALALEGASVVVGNVASSSLRQRLIPDELRGRVATVFRMAMLGSGVAGAATGGVLVGMAGMRSEMAMVAAFQLLVVAALCRADVPVAAAATEGPAAVSAA